MARVGDGRAGTTTRVQSPIIIDSTVARGVSSPTPYGVPGGAAHPFRPCPSTDAWRLRDRASRSSGVRPARAPGRGCAGGRGLQLPREADPLGPLFQVPRTGRACAQGLAPPGSPGGGVRHAAVWPSCRRARQHETERAGRPHSEHRPEVHDAGAGVQPLVVRLREGGPRPMGGTGCRLEAALVVDPAEEAGRARGQTGNLAARRHRSLRAGDARVERPDAVARSAARAMAATRHARPHRTTADAGRRSTPSLPIARRLRTRRSSIACWRRRRTASGWPPNGSMSPATPTRTATRTTACARCGRGATGSSQPSTGTCPSTGS